MRNLVHRLLRPTGFDLIGIRQRFVDPFEDQAKILNHTAAVIIDAGANVGDVTNQYRMLFPEATIFPFEPFKDCFQKITDRFKGDSRIRPEFMAVCDLEETRTLYVKNHPEMRI